MRYRSFTVAAPFAYGFAQGLRLKVGVPPAMAVDALVFTSSQYAKAYLNKYGHVEQTQRSRRGFITRRSRKMVRNASSRQSLARFATERRVRIES